MLNGTRWRFSSRFWAVTTSSSTRVVSASWAKAAPAAVSMVVANRIAGARWRRPFERLRFLCSCMASLPLREAPP